VKGVSRFRAQPTFVNSDKSRQKHRKEPSVPSPPGALYTELNLKSLPHVHAKLSFSGRHRIVSAPAPLPLIPAPNNAFAPTAATHERERCKKKVDASHTTMAADFREREIKGHKVTPQNSVRGFLNRRFKLSFWVLLGQRRQKYLVPEETKSPINNSQ